DLFFVDWMCPAGKVLQGIQAGEAVCVDRFKPQIRVVGGTVIDNYHSIYAAQCASDEIVIGGRCQCHASGTWLAGRGNNSSRSACTANPRYRGPVAVCMKPE